LRFALAIICPPALLARPIPQLGLTLPRRRGKPPLCNRLSAGRCVVAKARPAGRPNGKVSDV